MGFLLFCPLSLWRPPLVSSRSCRLSSGMMRLARPLLSEKRNCRPLSILHADRV